MSSFKKVRGILSFGIIIPLLSGCAAPVITILTMGPDVTYESKEEIDNYPNRLITNLIIEKRGVFLSSLTSNHNLRFLAMMANFVLPLPAVRVADHISFNMHGVTLDEIHYVIKRKLDWIEIYVRENQMSGNVMRVYENTIENEVSVTAYQAYSHEGFQYTTYIHVDIKSFDSKNIFGAIRKELNARLSDASKKVYQEAF